MLTTFHIASAPIHCHDRSVFNEPHDNLFEAVRLLDDGWTVRTADGMPSAHFEHTVLIQRGAPEVLTWRGKPQLK